MDVETDSKRELGKSMQEAQHDDDDDNYISTKIFR